MNLTHEFASESEKFCSCATVKWKIHNNEHQCASVIRWVRSNFCYWQSRTDHMHVVLKFSNAMCVGTGEVPFTLLSSFDAVFPPIISSHQLVEFVLSSYTVDRSNTSLRLLSILTAMFTKPKLNHIPSHLNPLYTITLSSLRSNLIQ